MLITSVNNEKVKYLMKLNQKKYRDNTFLVEGKHLVEEANKKGLIKQLILKEGETSSLDVDTIYVTREVMKKISSMDTCPSIMAEVYKKENTNIGNKILLLDDISDPGNLGTIIRSAIAFNFDTIIMSPNSVDLYNPKVLRSTEGMIFNINIIINDLEEKIKELKSNNYSILGTKVDGGTDISNYKSNEKIALIMGSEAKGIHNNLLDICDDYIYIKMNKKCESLNVGVSASILMYELSK